MSYTCRGEIVNYFLMSIRSHLPSTIYQRQNEKEEKKEVASETACGELNLIILTREIRPRRGTHTPLKLDGFESGVPFDEPFLGYGRKATGQMSADPDDGSFANSSNYIPWLE